MANIYQLKIELVGSNVPIWRRIQVPGDILFTELHDICQITMGWYNDHLHAFHIEGTRVYDFGSDIDKGKNPGKRDANDTSLDELVTKTNTSFTYLYDFGDHWEHLITLEHIFPAEENKQYPRCIDGSGACPPEDCGGSYCYGDLLQALHDKGHSLRKEALAILGENWDASFFNQKRTNFRLIKYGLNEQANQETDMASDQKEAERSPDRNDYGPEFKRLANITFPNDLLKTELHSNEIEGLLEDKIREQGSREQNTLNRLLTRGFDEETARELITEALAIEGFYTLKHDLWFFEDRYEYNLEQLPQEPSEFPFTNIAIRTLEHAEKGIPFRAIDYLQNDHAEETRTGIIDNLRNCTKEDYYEQKSELAPLWFAVAAEGHLCEELIDPVINLFTSEFFENDFLFEQGEWLISALAEKYPDIVIPKVISAAKGTFSQHENSPVLYLYDALYYADPAQYGDQLVEVLNHPDTIARDMWGHMVAHLQIKSALHVFDNLIAERKREKEQRGSNAGMFEFHDVIELEEAREELQTGVIKYPEQMRPAHLRREHWRTHYADLEDRFYDFEEEEEQDQYIPQDNDQVPPPRPPLASQQPIVKEKKPGRNDPCHCGSGKKYKKCCLRKDEEQELQAKK